MRKKIVESTIMFIIVLKHKLLWFSPVWVLILPLQTTLIFLHTMQTHIAPRQDSISLALTNIWSALTSDKASLTIIVLHFCFTIVLLASYLLYILVKKPYHELDPHALLFNRLMTMCALLVTLIQIMLFNLVWLFCSTLASIASRSQSTTAILELSVLALGSISLLKVVLINHRIRMMGVFFPLFIFVANLNLTVSFVDEMVGTVICIYMMHTDEASSFLLLKGHNIRKILHFILISYFAWRLIDSLQPNSSDYSSNMSFVFLLTHFLVGLIAGTLKFRDKINRKQPLVIQLCQCLQALQKRPDDLEYKMVALSIKQEYFRDVNNYMMWGRDAENGEIAADKLEEDLPKLQRLVHFMIKQEYAKQPSLESGINMIKCRLMIKDRRLFEIIYLLTDLISKYHNRDLVAKYEILKITMKIENHISQKQSNGTADILKAVEQLNLTFYDDCSKQIESIFQFWQVVANEIAHLDIDSAKNHDLPLGSIDSLVDKIQSRSISLRQCVKSISLLSVSTAEKQILERVERLTNFSSVEAQDDSVKWHANKKIGSISDANIYADYSQFLEVSQERITKVSLKLSTQLGYKIFELVGEKINSIIPADYQCEIGRAVSNHHEPSLKISCLIPLRCVDRTIIFKKLITFLQLDYNQGFKVYYFFYNSFRNQDPIIMYNTISNTIDFYNRPFLEAFNLDKMKIDASITSCCFRPDEFFADIELGDKNIQVKLTESDLETEYNCRMSTSKIGNAKTNKLEDIRLSNIEKEKHYMILKVMKGHRIKSFVGGDFKSQHSVSQSQISMLYENHSSLLQTKLSKLKNQVKDQSSIYCPIENPYQSKILNKKAELVSSKNFALKFYAVVCISIVTILMMAQGFFFVQINQRITSVMQQANEDTLNKFDQYESLMMAYKSYLQRVLITYQYENRTSLPVIQQLLDAAKQETELHASKFQKRYLENLLRNQKKAISYTIKFENFEVATDSSKSSLFDFSRNLLQFDDMQSLDFLLSNYPSLRYLISQESVYKSDMYNEAKFSVVIHYIVSGGILLIVMLCIGLSTLLRARVLNISSDVSFIYKLISPKKLDPLLYDLKILIENIPEIRERCQIKWGDKDTELMQQNSRLNKKSIEAEEVLLRMEEQDEVNLVVEQNRKKQLNDKRYEQHKMNKPLKLKELGIYGYIAVLAAIFIIFFFQILYFEHKIKDISSVFEFKIENRRVTHNVIRQILQAQYQLVQAHDNRNSQEKFTQIFVEKMSINSKKLPSPAFDEFYKAYFAKISDNLCTALTNKSLLQYGLEICLKVGNGVFSYGLPKSIEFLNRMLRLSVEKKYWMNESPYGGNLLQVQEVFYCSNMVMAINSESEVMLAKEELKFDSSYHDRAIMIFILACSLSMILVAINIYMKKYIYKASQIAVGLFLILPKAVLLQGDVLDHIRRNDMLKRISTI